MLKIYRSEKSVRKTLNDEPITLIYQFFKHKNMKRFHEIRESLWKNVNNNNIDRIILLNERMYSEEEIGVSNPKIQQIVIGNRLNFSDIFEYVEKLKIKGYIVTCNADIFFDNTLRNLKFTNIHEEKVVYSQLRFEYNNTQLSKCKLFGPRCDSQDSWIFHSNCNIPQKFRKLFKIKYGIRNCDLKINYLFSILNFKIINEPFFIKTYHYHSSNIRDYLNKPALERPIMFVIPHLNPANDLSLYPLNMWSGKSKTSYMQYSNDENNFIDNKDMLNMCSLIKYSDDNNLNFTVMKTNMHNCNLAYCSDKLQKNYDKNDKFSISTIISEMQGSILFYKNFGLKLDSLKKISLYVAKFFEICNKCQICIHTQVGHSDYINVINKDNPHNIKVGPVIHRFVLDFIRKCKNIPTSENILNIGAHIFNQGWFDILTKKKILIISKHYKLIKKQIDMLTTNNNNFYRRPIFKDCVYEYFDIPQTKTDNEDMVDTVNNYIKDFRENISIDSFDVVFIGDTVYDFLILDYINTIGKSGIIAGNFLPLWYGLYSKYHMKYNSDIVKMFMDENWKLLNE